MASKPSSFSLLLELLLLLFVLLLLPLLLLLLLVLAIVGASRAIPAGVAEPNLSTLLTAAAFFAHFRAISEDGVKID